MDNKDYVVVGMGEALWDCLPEGRKIGGAPANFAYHVSQFGLPGYVVSAVGNDLLGDEILQNFEDKNLNCLIQRVDYPTGTVLVNVDDKGIPSYNIMEESAWDNIPLTDDLLNLARRTKAVCFGSLAQRSDVSRETIYRFLEAIPEDPDRLVVFDINLRQHFYTPVNLVKSFKHCNVLKINDEELEIVSKMFSFGDIDFHDQCWILLAKYGLKMLILTCGTDGSYVFTPGKVSFQPTPSVTVADTVGAGDSFTAAFISCILKGLSVEEAHKKAVETSAYVCTKHGAMNELPDSIAKF